MATDHDLGRRDRLRHADPWSTASARVPVALLGSLAFLPFAVLITGVVFVFKQAGAGAGFLVTCLSLVAGVFFPVALLPNWIEWTSEVQPLTPALDLLRHLVVGTPIDSVWWAVFRLVAFDARPASALDPRPRRLPAARAAARHRARVLMSGRERRPSSEEILEAQAPGADHVVHRSFAHETVILNLKTGKYHGLNPTAGAMLTELERGATVAEAAATARGALRPAGRGDRAGPLRALPRPARARTDRADGLGRAAVRSRRSGDDG